MKAVVAAFNQEKALIGAFSVITNLRMELFQALLLTDRIHYSSQMMDIKGVKLRGTKSPPGNTKNHISAEDGPGQPAWKEDLKKNRGSVGLFLEKSLG